MNSRQADYTPMWKFDRDYPAQRDQGQEYQGKFYRNNIIPVPSSVERYFDQNARIFAQRNPPDKSITKNWRYFDSTGKEEAKTQYFESLMKKRGRNQLGDELTYANSSYGQPDPGMWGDLFQWQDDVFDSAWAKDYGDAPIFGAMRKDWEQNRHAYTAEQRYYSANQLLNYVTKRNERIFNTPQYKRGKLTMEDLSIKELMSSDDDESDQ